MNYIGHAVLKARFYQAAGDDAQATADAHRPKMFAKAEERAEWMAHEEIARAQRLRHVRVADAAATELLKAAGFRGLGRRGR